MKKTRQNKNLELGFSRRTDKSDAASGRFKIEPRFTQAADENLRRDNDNRWVSVTDPKADTVTYTHELVIDSLPAK